MDAWLVLSDDIALVSEGASEDDRPRLTRQSLLESRFILSMPRAALTDDQKTFVTDVATLEKRMFPGQMDDTDTARMKNVGKYSWLYRPSHHVATGLITKKDLELLMQPEKRMLSVGAHPAYLEQLLCILGVPAEHIFIADKDPGIALADGLMDRIIFDATGIWPEKIGTFDLIIFPESLCMAVGGDTKDKKDPKDFSGDAKEAAALAVILQQALKKLRDGGEIRANGPQSHPNVVKAATKILEDAGQKADIHYERYFLTVRKAS